MRCGRLGEPLRNSDPQIAAAVNDAAATGAEITLQDPIGLYLDGLLTGGMETPDGGRPRRVLDVERGTPRHAVRASFAVPAERGFRGGGHHASTAGRSSSARSWPTASASD